MTNLDDWVDAVKLDLGLTTPVDRALVLDLARDVAHGVARPAAPLTSFLLGLAVGACADPKQTAAAIARLAEGWNPERVSDTALED